MHAPRELNSGCAARGTSMLRDRPVGPVTPGGESQGR